MVLGRAQNDPLGLLDVFAQTGNVFGEARFIIFPITEHQLVIAQIDELSFALQLFGPFQSQRDSQRL